MDAQVIACVPVKIVERTERHCRQRQREVQLTIPNVADRRSHDLALDRNRFLDVAVHVGRHVVEHEVRFRQQRHHDRIVGHECAGHELDPVRAFLSRAGTNPGQRHRDHREDDQQVQKAARHVPAD